jgi:ABC-type Fe3+/spermidine/putrescine transport system ATPase subunit
VGSPEELYERPNSPFVARFMGAGNAVHLMVEGEAIAAGPGHARTVIAGDLTPHRRAALAGGPVIAFFRSQDAHLTGPDEPGLTLRGEVMQASYSGGFFRYAVQVGQDRFLIDDARRHQVGDPVGVSLPLDALHVYPDAAPATSSPGYQSS